MALVVAAVDIRQRKPGTKLDKRKGGRYAGRVRLAVVPKPVAPSRCADSSRTPWSQELWLSLTIGKATPAWKSAATNISLHTTWRCQRD